MRAGRLRTRVQLQERVEAANAYGERIETWSTAATVWGYVRELRGQEFVAAQTEQATLKVEVGIRERAGVSEQTRVVAKGRTLQVRGVSAPEKPGGVMVLMCEEIL